MRPLRGNYRVPPPPPPHEFGGGPPPHPPPGRGGAVGGGGAARPHAAPRAAASSSTSSCSLSITPLTSGQSNPNAAASSWICWVLASGECGAPSPVLGAARRRPASPRGRGARSGPLSLWERVGVRA